MNVQTGGMTYARFFPSDWRSGCLALTLEEEGLYIRCCAYMYDTGKQIPADEATAARLLNVNRLQYRKVMAALILKDKLIRAQGYIFNERVTAEIDRFRSEFAKRSAASKAREEARKKQLQVEIEKALKEKAAAEATPPVTPRVTPPVTPPVTRGVTPNELGGLLGGLGQEKANEIKAGGTRTQAETELSSGSNPESRIQKPEEERKILPPQGAESEAARGGGGGNYLDALNGTAVDLTAFIARHVGGNLDENEARRMLATNIKTFGAEAMMEAYSLTVAEMASGLLGKPYKYLIETARKLKDGRAPKAKADQPSKSEQRQARAARISAELQAEKAGRAQQ
jgi:uncharacterized protein YdaU (DUF1376 family)